jgi:cobyrinic acid a,c-diamide synthase
MTGPSPRLVIAGSAGDSGKTTVSLGLLARWRDRGLAPVAFKKGPDFIDAAWLGWASGNPGRNLDTYLMPRASVVRSFHVHSANAPVTLIEGNRGLADGMDAQGTHSTAALARLIEAPVVLVLPVTKTTATAAAIVIGLRAMEPDVRLAGVILNRVAGDRHERTCRAAIEHHAGVPVLGAIPRLPASILTDRHLGLVPPAETGGLDELRRKLVSLVDSYLEADRLLAVAREAVPLHWEGSTDEGANPQGGVRIGVLRDSAFTFYYPENLEALVARGATLVPVSSIEDGGLPPIDALYVGGGFPETHGERIAANGSFLAGLRAAAAAGMPIYAECGGLMLLCRSLSWKGARHAMAGVFPLDLDVKARPQGHGYASARVDRENPYYPVGTELLGHEFHYSCVSGGDQSVPTAMAVTRGAGCLAGRDGLVAGRVFASYLHVHALGIPAWADGLVRAAREFASARRTARGAAFDAGERRVSAAVC